MPRCFLRITVLLCLICVVAACGRDDVVPATPTSVPSSTATPGPAGVTYVVQRGRVVRTVEFSGRIVPVEEVPLYFKAGGYVKRVLVQPGDQVEAGDLLAELESDLGIDGLQNQIGAAELNLAVAEARLTHAEQANTYAIAQAEMVLALVQEQLARTRALQATYTAATVQARVGLEQAQVQVDQAEIEYQEAVDRHWMPPEHAEAYALVLQQARWNLETAQAQYDQAIANEEVYRRDLKIAEIAVKQAEADLDQLKRGVDPVLAIEVQKAQQTINRLRESTQIVAPVDGEIVSLSLYPGRPVEPFARVVVIADPSVIEVSAGLSTDQLRDLNEGRMATVALSASQDRVWTGIVRRLPYPYGTGGASENLASIDNSARISLEGDVGQLKLGDLVRVTIVLEEADNTLWLPPAAIRTFQDHPFVIIQEDGSQRRIDVALGIDGQAQVEILAGLEEGQTVVVP